MLYSDADDGRRMDGYNSNTRFQITDFTGHILKRSKDVNAAHKIGEGPGRPYGSK